MADNVIALETAHREAVPASDTPPDFIKPRSIVDMTDTEADAFLVALRERRLRAAEMIKQQKAAKAAVDSAVARQKIEKKIAQCERAEERLGVALDKLETLVFQLRALVLQHE